MSSVAYNQILDQIDMLSYSDRLLLLEKIANSLNVPKQHSLKSESKAFDEAFGLWKDRDISLESLRIKASVKEGVLPGSAMRRRKTS